MLKQPEKIRKTIQKPHYNWLHGNLKQIVAIQERCAFRGEFKTLSQRTNLLKVLYVANTSPLKMEMPIFHVFSKLFQISNYSRTFWHHLYTQTNDSARGPIDMIVGTLDSRTRTRTSTRFDCPFLAKILRKFLTGPLIFLFVSSIGCSVILIAGN